MKHIRNFSFWTDGEETIFVSNISGYRKFDGERVKWLSRRYYFLIDGLPDFKNIQWIKENELKKTFKKVKQAA